MPRLILTLLALLPVLMLFSASPAAPASAADQPLVPPIRAAFYYPWYPEKWSSHGYPGGSVYLPGLGYYDSSVPANVARHLAQMQYGGIQAGITSWWGPDSPTDRRVPLLLDAARPTAFRWALYYEREGYDNPSPATIASDLAYIRDHYASDPAYLRIGGRFVVFAYGNGADGCDTAARWQQANSLGAYVVLKVFWGYRACPSQPDGWHQYAPEVTDDNQWPYSYSISPGFWIRNQAPLLPRDLARWEQSVRAMNGSGAAFQLITTYNEWLEGTAVEDASEWSSPSGFGAFLDVLHRYPPAGAAIGIPSPTPTSSPVATPTPTPMPPTPAPPPVSRPPVRLTTTVAGPGTLRVTLTAGTGSLQAVRLGVLSNASVEIGGQTYRDSATVNLPSRPTQLTILVRRVVPGQAVTVPLTVVDDGGNWPTFVGGGPTAF